MTNLERTEFQPIGLTVSVFGPPKSGKSELVNWIVGRRLLPTGAQETGRATLVLDHADAPALAIEAQQERWNPGRVHQVASEHDLSFRLLSLVGLCSVAAELGLVLEPVRLHIGADLRAGAQVLGATPGTRLRLVEVAAISNPDTARWLAESLPILMLDATRLTWVEEIGEAARRLARESQIGNNGAPVVVVVNKVDQRSHEDRSVLESVRGLEGTLRRHLPRGAFTFVPASVGLLALARQMDFLLSKKPLGRPDTALRAIGETAFRRFGPLMAARAVTPEARRQLRNLQDRLEEDQPLVRPAYEALAALCSDAGGGGALKEAFRRTMGLASAKTCRLPAAPPFVRPPLPRRSTEERARRVHLAGQVLRAGIHASGRVRAEELRLGRLLLADYVHRFVAPAPELSPDPLLLAGPAVGREHGLAALAELAADGAEREWLVHAILAMAGIDQEFPEPEKLFVLEALRLLCVPLCRA